MVSTTSAWQLDMRVLLRRSFCQIAFVRELPCRQRPPASLSRVGDGKIVDLFVFILSSAATMWYLGILYVVAAKASKHQSMRTPKPFPCTISNIMQESNRSEQTLAAIEWRRNDDHQASNECGQTYTPCEPRLDPLQSQAPRNHPRRSPPRPLRHPS